MKKITITLSDKAEAYFNEVQYSLDKGDGKVATQSEVINEILETNSDFESVEDQSVSGWLRDYRNFYKATDLTPEELDIVERYNQLFTRNF